MPYTEVELLDAAVLAYDDYRSVEAEMRDDETISGSDYTILEMYKYAMSHDMGDSVGWTTSLLDDYPGDIHKVFGDWTLMYSSEPQLNKDSGVCLSIFRTRPDSAIIAFRGSEGGDQSQIDSIDGALWMGLVTETERMEAIDTVVAKLVEDGVFEGIKHLAGAGHSQGGSDMVRAMFKLEELGICVELCIPFDAPGHSKSYIEKHQAQFDAISDRVMFLDFSWASELYFRFEGAHSETLDTRPPGTYTIGPDTEMQDKLDNLWWKAALIAPLTYKMDAASTVGKIANALKEHSPFSPLRSADGVLEGRMPRLRITRGSTASCLGYPRSRQSRSRPRPPSPRLTLPSS